MYRAFFVVVPLLVDVSTISATTLLQLNCHSLWNHFCHTCCGEHVLEKCNSELEQLVILDCERIGMIRCIDTDYGKDSDAYRISLPLWNSVLRQDWITYRYLNAYHLLLVPKWLRTRFSTVLIVVMYLTVSCMLSNSRLQLVIYPRRYTRMYNLVLI